MSLIVSVLVPAWEEAGGLGSTLAALNLVEYPAWELLVIAGGKDASFALAQSLAKSFTACPIQIIEQKPNGKNAALNQGLQQAKGSIIVILDADTLVRPNWLAELLKALGNGAAVCGNYFPKRETWVSALEQMEKIVAYQIQQRVILQGSGSIAIKRDVLERIGGFPEAVKVGVDYDLDMRLTKAAYSKAFAEAAIVYTERPASLAEFWRNELRWRRGHLRLLLQAKHSIGPLFKEALFYIVAIALGLLLLSAVLSALLGFSEISALCWLVLGLSLLYFLARRSLLAWQVAQFTGEKRYLKLLWIPPFFLLLSYLAAWAALGTIQVNTVHFKGARSQ